MNLGLICKRVLSLGGLAAALLGAGLAQASPVIIVSASQSSVQVGDSFSINFAIAGLSSQLKSSLSGFDIDVLMNPALAGFTGFSFTDPASGANQLDLPEPGSFGFMGDAHANGAVIDAYGLSGNSEALLDASQADEFRFLSLMFTALAPSSAAAFSIDLGDSFLLFLDSGADLLNVDFQSARAVVEITANSGQVPEPAALALTCLALLAMSLSLNRAKTAALLRQLAPGLGMLLGALAFSGAAQAEAQVQPQSSLAAPPLASSANDDNKRSTPIDAVVLEVAGSRAKLKAMDDGRVFWITTSSSLGADKVGLRMQGLAQARGDSIYVGTPSFLRKP